MASITSLVFAVLSLVCSVQEEFVPSREDSTAGNATADPTGAHDDKRVVRPLKVFILAGQSNMQGHANVSTLDSMADDPKTAPILKEMRNADGTPRVCDKVWISSVGCAGDGWSDVIEQKGKLTAGFGASTAEIGPEFTFGIDMEKALGEPILLIKTSWGGRSLHTDFRPPGAGPETFNEYILSQWKKRGLDAGQEAAKINQNVGVFYRHMIKHVRQVLADIKRVVPEYDPNQGYELAGFVWFQGFNDMIDDWTYHDPMTPGGYDPYSQLLAQFIRDVRKDLSAPRLPFVIGVMGIGGVKEGEKPPQMYFRQAQAAPASLPEFQGNVVAVQTASYWDNDLDALEQRREKLNEKLDQEAKKDPTLSQGAREEAYKKAMARSFTPEELKRMKGMSNGGYPMSSTFGHIFSIARRGSPLSMAALVAVLLPCAAAAQPSAITTHADGLHGYIHYDAQPNPDKAQYSAGIGFYSAVWALHRPTAHRVPDWPPGLLDPARQLRQQGPAVGSRGYAGPGLEGAGPDMEQRLPDRGGRTGVLGGEPFPLRMAEIQHERHSPVLRLRDRISGVVLLLQQ